MGSNSTFLRDNDYGDDVVVASSNGDGSGSASAIATTSSSGNPNLSASQMQLLSQKGQEVDTYMKGNKLVRF